MEQASTYCTWHIKSQNVARCFQYDIFDLSIYNFCLKSKSEFGISCLFVTERGLRLLLFKGDHKLNEHLFLSLFDKL